MADGSHLGAQAARRLAELGHRVVEAGLTEAELARVEREYGFEFADDHRAFLATGLPVDEPEEEGQTWDKPWPDWRDGDPSELRRHLDWPVNWLLSEIEHGFWLPAWGARPDTSEEAVDGARARLAEAPTMVPVYAHRFLPAGRGSHGHPVLSMWGTDIICYGTDLLDYVVREFVEPERPDGWVPNATVPFWRDFL